MHFVDCGNEPASLRELVKYHANGEPDWDTRGERGSIFYRDLGRPFDRLCGYCERPCHGRQRGKPDSNEVDHFRPRSRYSKLTFEWENLVYTCHRCNWKKDDQFPNGEKDNSRLDELENRLAARKNRRDELKNQLAALQPGGAVKDPRHIPRVKSIQDEEIPRIKKEIKRIKERIKDTKRSDSEIKEFERKFPNKKFAHPPEADGYVNPRDRAEKAETFFVFNHLGEIHPNPDLDDRKWSMAVRIICDLDLNPVKPGHRAEDLLTLRKEAFWKCAQVAREAARGRTRNAKRMLDSLDKVRPGFPSFVDWASGNALSPT